MTRRKAAAGIVLALVAACLIGVRIWVVNAQAVTVPTAHYQMGEWIDLSGSYFFDLAGEDMEGYSLRINSAEALSYDEYVSRYAKEQPDPEAATRDRSQAVPTVSDDPDQKTIVVLEYEVKNEGNDAGGIGLYQESLIPVRKNDAYKMDRYLWLLAEPQMKDSNVGGIGLKKDTTYTTHVPFAATSHPGYFEKLDRKVLQLIGDDASFQLTLCNAPVRTVVDIEL